MRKNKNIHLHRSHSRYNRAALMILNLGIITAVLGAPSNIKHTMLITGTGLSYVGIVDTTGKLIWKHSENEGAAGNGQKNDSWLLPDGNVAYSYQWGIRIVNVRTDKVIWDRRTPQRGGQTGETHSCQPIDGRSDKFLIPECFNDTAFIVEVDTTGKEGRRIGILNQGGGTHGKWRQIRKTKQNTYLVSSMDLYRGYEFDTTGHLVHEFPAGGYVMWRLDNGNTITGTGGNCRFVEFNPSGTQVWEVNNSNLAISGVGIGFASELQRLPNGHTIVTNWGGHGTGSGSAVVEILPDRSVVGAIPDSFPSSIASLKIIDGWKSTARQYTLSVSAGPNGVISPSGALFADSGTNKTFTITPDNGYGIDSVKVDGEKIEGTGTFSFSNIHAPHTISVTFAKNVGTRQHRMQSIRTATPLITIAQSGVITCSVPYSNNTLIRVFNCEGRIVFEQSVSSAGDCTIPKVFTNGIYTVVLKNVSEEKKWSHTVVINNQ